MLRPRSIAIFEIAYLAALAINLAGPFLIWSALTANVAEQAHAGTDAAGVVNGVLIGGIVVAGIIGLLLWWFVARRGSNVARWIMVVLLGYSIVSGALQLTQSGGPLDLVRIVALLGLIFTAVALVSLFMKDARTWFAEEPEDLV